MPTYQYACTECHHAFEQVQKFSDDALTVCPECQGRLRKVFNAVGVVFKGSGFYRTDSRADGSRTSSSSSGSGSTDGSGSSSSSSSETGSGSSSSKDSASSSSGSGSGSNSSSNTSSTSGTAS